MRKIFLIPFLFMSLAVTPACSEDNNEPMPDNGQTDGTDDQEDSNGSGSQEDQLGGEKILVAYFSATGNTEAVAKRIAEFTGAAVYSIEPSDPYSENPYDDSTRIQNEAYGDLRPEVANLPDPDEMAQYDVIFVGSPIWWHQPAMVVCTFLDAYDLSGKTVIPFFTFGATTYLNESMQKIFRLTPNSRHIPESLPEDLAADDITVPGPSDDAGIDMPGNAGGTEAWLRRIGIIE